MWRTAKSYKENPTECDASLGQHDKKGVVVVISTKEKSHHANSKEYKNPTECDASFVSMTKEKLRKMENIMFEHNEGHTLIMFILLPINIGQPIMLG